MSTRRYKPIRVEPFTDEINGSIKVTVGIEHHIIEGEQWSFCRAQIIVGRETGEHLILPGHKGPRSGQEWERTKGYWQTQVDYIASNIDHLLLNATAQVCNESSYTIRGKSTVQEMFSTSADLERFHKSLISWTEAPVPFDSDFQMWVGTYASEIQQRLTGNARRPVDTNASDRNFDKALEAKPTVSEETAGREEGT